MSDDLDRVVDARIDSYRPATAPPFAALQSRKRSRDRRRTAAGAGALSVAALTAGAVVVPTFTGDGERIVPAAPGGGAVRVQFEVAYTAGPDALGGADPLQNCTTYPGGSRDLQKQTDPPVEAVSVIGRPDGVAEFRQCLEDLPNARITETGRTPLDRLVTFTLDYRTAVARPQDDQALLRCLDGPVATTPTFQYRQPPLGVLLAGGSESELAAVQRCLAALPNVDVTVSDAEARSATITVHVERRTSREVGVPDSRRVQQCIGTLGTFGAKMSDPPVYQAAVAATPAQLEAARSCLTALDFVTSVEVRDRP